MQLEASYVYGNQHQHRHWQRIFKKTRFNNSDSRRMLCLKSKKGTNGKEIVVRHIIRYAMDFSTHGQTELD